MSLRYHLRVRSFFAIAVLLLMSSVAIARSAPRLTIRNNASEALLVHYAGPADGLVSMGGETARTVTLPRGTYRLFFRWGAGRYRYTKLENPVSLSDDEEVELTLYTVAGNVDEDPSNEAEFSGR